MKMNNILVKVTENKESKKVSLNKNGPFVFFMWFVKVEIIVLVLIFSLMLIYINIPNETKFYIKYELSRLFLKNHENYDDVKKSSIDDVLKRNQFIEDNEEKEFISNLFYEELNENKKYIDIELIQNKLSNVKVNVYASSNNPISGSYNPVFNEIILYNDLNLDKKFSKMSTQEKQIYFHELNHLMTNYSLTSSIKSLSSGIDTKNSILNVHSTNIANIAYNDFLINSNNILSELVNELFAIEYFYSYENEFVSISYKDKMPYIYVMAEIIDEESLKEFKFNDNISVIVDDLIKIDSNIDRAYNLIDNLNKIDLLGDNKYKKEVYKELSYYYNKKFNENINDNIGILCYLYTTETLDSNDMQKVRDYLKIKDNEIFKIKEIIPRGYVSETYKEKHKNMIVVYNYYGNKQKEILY